MDFLPATQREGRWRFQDGPVPTYFRERLRVVRRATARFPTQLRRANQAAMKCWPHRLAYSRAPTPEPLKTPNRGRKPRPSMKLSRSFCCQVGSWEGFDGWRATPHRNCESSAAHAVGLGFPSNRRSFLVCPHGSRLCKPTACAAIKAGGERRHFAIRAIPNNRYKRSSHRRASVDSLGMPNWIMRAVRNVRLGAIISARRSGLRA